MELIYSSITFLLGLLIGNWMAIGRDRRREFNETATPLYKKLISYLDKEGYKELPPIEDIEHAIEYMRGLKRHRYKALMVELKEELALERQATSWDQKNQKIVVKTSYQPKKNEIIKSIVKLLRRI